MPRKKKQVAEFLATPPEISVGLVKQFEFYDSAYADKLNGHPAEGRVYRIIKDVDSTNNTTFYRIHIGRENNSRGLDGLFLGFSLEGAAEDQYKFKIEEITKENFLDFDLTEEDIKKVSGWFETDHSDLRKLLGLPSVLATDSPQDVDPLAVSEANSLISFLEKSADELTSLNEFPRNFDKIFFKDAELAKVMADYTEYVASTYNDKYESSGRKNFGRDFLLSSNSPDVAIFNAIKYLQRYCTTGFDKSGNTKDLYKALHYIMFELIRKNRQNG